jgi:hypothetical protein
MPGEKHVKKPGPANSDRTRKEGTMFTARSSTVLVAVAVAASLVACASPERAVGPGPSMQPRDAASTDALASGGKGARPINVMDACDGPSFNAVIGPGTCARPNGVNFNEFVAQLTAHQSAGAWHNAPAQTDAWVGDALIAVNKGGEVHTFTKVAQFGGGIVPFLNQLAGTPNVVPECLNLPPSEFMLPGGTDQETLDATGDIKFQCCIHPWMTTTVRVKSK